MENLSLNDRIAELIHFLELSPTAFADEIGVQRSGLSHILKGRNKPSLDMVQKIVSRFPEVSLTWLVNGTGHISSSTPSVINLQQKTAVRTTPAPAQDNLFKNTLFDTEKPVSATDVPPPAKAFTQEDFLVKESVPIQESAPEPHNVPQERAFVPPAPAPGTLRQSKSIAKILVFYDDQTFEEFLK